MSVLKFTYQPSRSIEEVNKQVTELTEMLKSELLECATVSSMDELAFEVKQVDENGNQKFAQVNAVVGDTSAKVSMLATFNQAQGSITISAALKNGIEQSDIVLTGDHITLDGDVTITSGFKLSGDHIQANTITSTQIHSATITADEIAGRTITAAEIKSDTITSNEIAARTITANEIASHTITASEIHAGTITANEIAAHTITANEISTSYVYAGTIDADKINAGNLNVGGYQIRFGTGYNFYQGGAFDKNYVKWYDAIVAEPNFATSRIISSYATFTNLQSSSGTDLVITADGHVREKSGSTKRVKNSISSKLTEEMDPHRLYKLPIVQFKYNTDYITDKEDQRYDTPLIGFIAEDMELIYPQAVKLDGEKKPNGWDPYYIIPPMLALIQEQDKRIKRLEGKNGE